MEWAGSISMCGGLKFGRGTSGVRGPSPTPGPAAQGSSARKTSPHKFRLQKPAGIESVEETSGDRSNSC